MLPQWDIMVTGGMKYLKKRHPRGNDFLAKVTGDWEGEALKGEEKGIRVVMTRFGIVLGKDGGAMKKMLPAFRYFAGGPMGNGRQWFPWIHMDDSFIRSDVGNGKYQYQRTGQFLFPSTG